MFCPFVFEGIEMVITSIENEFCVLLEYPQTQSNMLPYFSPQQIPILVVVQIL